MVSGSSGENRLKRLTKQVPDHKATVELLVALDSDHKAKGIVGDRSAGIVGGAVVENAVKVVIIAHLVPLPEKKDFNAVFGSAGPLYSFSSKIVMAHALGVFGPKTKSDLDIIRNVRNTFAHSLHRISFAHPDIASECAKLHHSGNADLALMLRGPKGSFVRSVVNISDALRKKVEGLGLLGRVPFPDETLP